jgi:hypothetical protein
VPALLRRKFPPSTTCCNSDPATAPDPHRTTEIIVRPPHGLSSCTARCVSLGGQGRESSGQLETQFEPAQGGLICATSKLVRPWRACRPQADSTPPLPF